MNRTEEITITTWADDESELTVTGRFHPGMKGARGDYGEPLEPDDPDEMEILDARDNLGNTRTLSEAEEERALEELWSAEL